MNIRAKTAEPCRPGFGRAYHIERNAALDRWDISDDDGRVIGHSKDLGHATDWAIREARNDHSAGQDVIVCLQQDDGNYSMVWSSR